MFGGLTLDSPLSYSVRDFFLNAGSQGIVVRVVIAFTTEADAQRGVWKAPAGVDAALTGVPQLEVPLTDAENGSINPLGQV